VKSYKLTTVETQNIASLLFDQKLTDRDAKHCVSTVGLTVTFHAQEKKSYALKGQRSFNPPQRGGGKCPKTNRPERAAEKKL
jgi:hypothetical protein